ncbi:TSUP family transporter, partial [Burkholderia sp. Cy-647]|nr:TSUP family transporter [Burkholderia sp. Cy-647]
MIDDGSTLAVVVAVFALAGVVKGMIGLGLPTIAMGLLTLAMPPAAAASLLVVPSLVTNVWQLLRGPAFGALARRLATLLAGLALGTFAGGLPSL